MTKTLLAAAVLLSLCSRSLAVDDSALSTAQTLNYCLVSLFNITEFQDRVVLEQEIDGIINNINLRSIPDVRLVELFKSLQERATEQQISLEERKLLQGEYEDSMRNALRESLAAARPSGVSGVSPLVVLNVLQSCGSSYFSYRDKQRQYRKELKAKNWQLDKEALRKMAQIQGDFLVASYNLGEKFKFPDEWRLTEKQIKKYLDVLKEEKLDLRLRQLERMKGDFEAYPPFWYYYGRSAQDLGQGPLALQAYQRFDEILRPILRKDPYAAAVSMSRMALLQQTDKDYLAQKKYEGDLQRMIANAQDADGNYYLFGAILLAQTGQYGAAERYIQTNVDNRQMVELSQLVAAEVTAGKGDLVRLGKILDWLLADKKTKMQEVLYLVGRIRVKDAVAKVAQQIEGIRVTPRGGLVGKADVEVSLPEKWVYGDAMEVSLVQGARPPERYSKMTLEEKERRVSLVFGGVLDKSDFTENRLEKLVVVMKPTTRDEPVTLTYAPEFEWLVVPLLEQAKVRRLAGFRLEKVSLLGETFACDAGGRVVLR